MNDPRKSKGFNEMNEGFLKAPVVIARPKGVSVSNIRTLKKHLLTDSLTIN